MSTSDMSRRGFMAATAGTATVVAASGTAAAEEVPEFSAYLDDARGFDDTQVSDMRGEDEVTVEVGAGDEGLAYDPPALWIDPDTTVVFEWTGDGGGHNVSLFEGSGNFGFDDIISDPGVHYEFTASEEDTEENDGIIEYKCSPHEGQGMKGGIAIGDDVPTTDLSEAGPAVQIPDQALALTVATLIAMGTTLGLGYFFMKYGGDYEE